MQIHGLNRVVASRMAVAALAVPFDIGVASGHSPTQPPHQSFNEGDLKLEGGGVIKDLGVAGLV